MVRNLTLDSKLCIRDEKILPKRHDLRTHKQQAVSDWLNPLSLGIMSASGYIANLAETCDSQAYIYLNALQAKCMPCDGLSFYK